MRFFFSMSVDMLLKIKWVSECFVVYGIFLFSVIYIRVYSFNMSCKVVEGSKDFVIFFISIFFCEEKDIFYLLNIYR